MAIFLGDITALRFWFGECRTTHSARPLEATAEYEDATAAKDAIPWELLERLGIAGEIHIDVPRRGGRHALSRVTAHLFANPPIHSFVRLAREAYIESPIAALMHMAPRLTRGECIFLLNQLCGSYRIAPGGIAECRPLATLKEVEAYILSARRRKGVNRLRPLLKYVVPGVASPAEARVAALLTMPVRWGGYGLPIPLANARVEVKTPEGSACRYADLLWPEFGLILEYDSDLHHAGAEKIGQDSARRALLQNEGFTVVTLTNYQLKDRERFDGVVRVLCKAMGLPFKPALRVDFEQRNAELRSGLRRVRVLR